MLARGLTRDTTVVALGGGITTDLAGFVAGTYLRGVPWIAVPTSLLAAVDAGIGGKVGVNTQAGKNVIGLFHRPLSVLIDVDLIATLPPHEVDNGLAEMVKHGAIADRAYLDALVSRAQRLRTLQPGALAPLIRRSVEIKAGVVAADPQESDYRQVLNAGHTIAHALELVSGLRINHGRAVAIGLSVEARMATLLGLLSATERDALIQTLTALSLPTMVPVDLDPADIVRATAIDKKARRGRPRYTLLARLGSVARGAEGFAREVDEKIALEAIEESRQGPE
jgi:3-dehydroquinate synthase